MGLDIKTVENHSFIRDQLRANASGLLPNRRYFTIVQMLEDYSHYTDLSSRGSSLRSCTHCLSHLHGAEQLLCVIILFSLYSDTPRD